MIKSVANEYQWPPQTIGGFFVDGQDFEGLEYWFDEVKRIEKIMKPKRK
jgi:hypothetical protein